MKAILSVFTIVILLVTLVPAPLYGEENPPVDRGDGVLENEGDWLIEEGEDFGYADKTIIINGNLTINGTLSLTRCHLIMNSSYPTISVPGTLNLDTTNVSGNQSGSYYYFIITGELQSSDSNFSEIAGDDVPPYAGGLQLYSEDVNITGGSIHDCEEAGMFVNTNVTIRNIIVEWNANNVIVNNSAPVFMDCIMRYPGGSSFRLYNGAHPVFISGVSGTYTFTDDESSWSKGHRLNVHVTYENGTSIPEATVTAVSKDSLATGQELTDEFGWVRNMVLPQETVYASGQVDTLYAPYLVSVKKFGLTVLDSVPFESDTTLHLVLTGDYFGEAITRGDYNGDGFTDLAVGVPRNRTGLDMHGAVFVYLNDGGLELTEPDESMADLIIPGVEGIGFGSVLTSGDINGDGYDDLIASTPNSSENGIESGRVYFFYGDQEPAWDDLSDAAFTFDGDPGSHYGKRLFVGNINNDEFLDFIIGDDLNSYVYHSTAHPDEDFSRISEIYSFAASKGSLDTTGEPISQIQLNDDVRYDVQNPDTPYNKLHIRNFTFTGIQGEITAITLQIQFATEQWYGWGGDQRSYIYYRIGENGDWQESLRPQYNQQNWRDESTWTYDLVADGITTIEQLEEIEFYFENNDGDRGGNDNAYDIYFDYMFLHVIAVPSGANNTLEAGNISSGDVNGDGFTDLILSDVEGQTIYFGGPLGISAPEIQETDLTIGNSSNLRVVSGNLTISETRPYLNGQFDDVWNGWYQVANSYGNKDGGVRWSIVETENGDWKVHEGPTGGFGSDQNSLDSGSNRDCRGMLRTGDFLVTDDMETLHFWYNFGARSFDPAGGQQGNVADQIRYRIYSAQNDSVLMELAGWTAPPGSSADHDEDGTVDADISGLRGEVVYFGFEIITNRGQDRAIAQIDNLTILPASDIPYYENGSLESKWFTFEANLQSITPSWVQDVTGGNVTVRFRTNNATDWNDTIAFVSGQQQTTSGTDARFQYRIEMSGDGQGTPHLSDLRIGVLLEGQIMPLPLMANYGYVAAGDMDGNGADDLLFLDEGSGRAQGIDIYYGHGNITDEYNQTNIQDLYDGEVTAFSVLDLESDGTDELALIGDSIRIIDSNSDILWERMVEASRIFMDAASDRSHQLNVGTVYFIPTHDHDILVQRIEVPAHVDPGEQQSVNVSVGNLGTEDADGLTLYLNITADGYSTTDSQPLDLDSMKMATLQFLWDVPSEEGVEYAITAEVMRSMDRDPGNNHMSKTVISKQHGILLNTSNASSSAHGADELIYSLTLENTGTFETENVSLAALLPQDWSGEFRIGGNLSIDHIIVQDSADCDFVAWSLPDEDQGNFTINLTATAVTAVSYLDLTATILRPDLVVDDIQLLRADGVLTNDTLHGVSGDLATIRVRVTNHGPTYATGFTLSLSKDGGSYEDFIHDRLGPGESVWFTIGIVPEEGAMNLSAEVDSLGEVPEEDETNNQHWEEFTIKGTDPVGSYELTGVILNIAGDGVGSADITLEWDSDSDNIITDENGTFSYIIPAGFYHDTTILILNATDGENLTSVSIILYSEDGGKHLVLTLNQYVVGITGPDIVSTVKPGRTVNFTLQVTNLGNVNATFIVVPSEVPEDWTITLPDLPGGAVTLSIEETAQVIVSITSSADPLLARGYQRYYLTIMVYPEIYPAGNDTFTHSVEVIPVRSVRVTTEGDNTSLARPGEQIQFSFVVENLGNVDDTFIPELLGGTVPGYSFDIAYANIDIGDHAEFSLSLVMPHLASGTELGLQVGGSGTHIQNADIMITALDLYGVECYCPTAFQAEPGDILSIPLTITNSGNLPENITITVWTDEPGLVIPDEYVLLIMEEEVIHSLQVTVPVHALAGEVIPLIINLSAGTASVSLRTDITVLEVSGITLTLLETVIQPRTDGTIYSYEIGAENTGNDRNTFHFKAEGTHPGYLSLPDPMTLDVQESMVIYARIVVPFNRTGVIDNYLIPMDETTAYGDLNLRILSYEPKLDTEVIMYQGTSLADSNLSSEEDREGPVYFYEVTVTNNGDRFERISVDPKIPVASGYGAGEPKWAGGVNKEYLEIFPGDMEQFRLWVTTPERKEYWGSDLMVILRSESGKSTDLFLHKPPIAIIGASVPVDVTFEDSIGFTGSQSVWNILEYLWDFGDGSTATTTSADHTFGRSGTHTVTLRITDDMGLTATSTVIVEIGNMAPIAIIQVQPLTRVIEIGEPIKLDASFSQDRDGEVVSYLWEFGEFGDFYEGMWPIIEHSYAVAGIYTITLHVTDNMGDTTNTTTEVTVTERSVDPNGEPEVDVIETTDPLTYVPLVLIVLIAIIGAVLVMRKRMFIDHCVKKIHKMGGKK